MAFWSGIPLVGDVLDAVTGQGQIDAINRSTKGTLALQKEHLAMLKRIFGEGMSAIAQARAGGVFDPEKMRASVSRWVDSAIAKVAAKGLIAGAKEGDTVQSENIAQSAIEGGRALEDVDFQALQRELGALQGVLPSAGAAGGAIGDLAGLDMNRLSLIGGAQQQGYANLGNLAFLGSQFFNSRPRFGSSTGSGKTGNPNG